MDRDGERQPHEHARRVVLDFLVDERLDLAECDDLVVSRLDLAAVHAQDGGVEEHILTTRQLGVEAPLRLR